MIYSIYAADVTKFASVKTLEGQTVCVASHKGIEVNDAKMIKTDITCDNGVIHVIDAVLTLPAGKSSER